MKGQRRTIVGRLDALLHRAGALSRAQPPVTRVSRASRWRCDALVMFGLLLVSCGGSDSSGNPPPPQDEITAAPATAYVASGHVGGRLTDDGGSSPPRW